MIEYHCHATNYPQKLGKRAPITVEPYPSNWNWTPKYKLVPHSYKLVYNPLYHKPQ